MCGIFFLTLFSANICVSIVSDYVKSWFLIVSLMLQLANVSKWFVWISGFPFSALVYLATQSQIPATSAAKISVHILETLQLARSKYTSLLLPEPYPIFKKNFHRVSIGLVSVWSFLLLLTSFVFSFSHVPHNLGAVMWQEKLISAMEYLKNYCRLWKHSNF